MDIYDVKSNERSGSKLFHAGDTVYIRPDLKQSYRQPVVCPQMLSFKGVKDQISVVNANLETYRLRKTPFLWADWLLLSESEYDEMMSPGPDKSDVLSMFD
jgi:hypothetical protein